MLGNQRSRASIRGAYQQEGVRPGAQAVQAFWPPIAKPGSKGNTAQTALLRLCCAGTSTRAKQRDGEPGKQKNTFSERSQLMPSWLLLGPDAIWYLVCRPLIVRWEGLAQANIHPSEAPKGRVEGRSRLLISRPNSSQERRCSVLLICVSAQDIPEFALKCHFSAIGHAKCKEYTSQFSPKCQALMRNMGQTLRNLEKGGTSTGSRRKCQGGSGERYSRTKSARRENGAGSGRYCFSASGSL